MKNDLTKITFIGDLTVDRPLLTYSHLGSNKFNFTEVFDMVRDDFKEKDLVVGNLETTCGGSKDFFKTEYMLLNTPDEFVEAIAGANIDMLVTANNHTLDQNIKGVIRTLDLLDKNGLDHTGTYRNKKEFDELYIKELNGCKIAIVAGTYGINESNIDYRFKEENSHHIDVMRSQEIVFPSTPAGRVKKLITRIFPPRIIRSVRRIVARRKLRKSGQFFSVYVDQIKDGDFEDKYYRRWIEKIERAKNLADIVFVMPHSGGQFNLEPGPYSKSLMDKLLAMDVHVLANHPHIIQEIVKKDDKLGVYSIGGFTMSLSGDYVLKEALPQYSLGINFYLDGKDLVKTSYSLYTLVENSEGGLKVYPIQTRYKELDGPEKKKFEEEIREINKRIGTSYEDIREEYDL